MHGLRYNRIQCPPVWVIVLVGLLIRPELSRADELTAESLLASDCVLAVRFDGLKPHESALGETVLGKLVDGELAPLIADLKQRAINAIGPDVVAGKLLDGASPEEVATLSADAKRLPRLGQIVHERGFAFGVNVAERALPLVQVAIVFPNTSDDDCAAIQAAIRLIARVAEMELTDETISERAITQGPLPNGAGQLACWREGKHFVVTLGVQPPSTTIDVAEGRAKRLTDNPAWQKLAAFDEYPTYARGVADTARLQSLLVKFYPPAQAILAQLGVDGVNQIAFHSGFEGKYQRTTVAVSTTGERRGLLKLQAEGPSLDVSRLTGLPPDASSLYIMHSPTDKTYKYAMETIEKIVSIVDPGAVEEFRRQKTEFETALGGPALEKFLSSLGPTATVYMDATSGLPFFGYAAAIEIRDAKILAEAQDDVLQALERTARGAVEFEQRTYRGVTLHVMHAKDSFFPASPAIAVCDNWLLIGATSQAVQATIYRMRTGAASLKLSPELRSRLEALTGKAGDNKANDGIKILFVAQSDPRPSVQFAMAALPFYGRLVGMFAGDEGPFAGFDLTLIPPAQAVIDPLSENFAIAWDDGESLRFDTYSTFPMPFDLSSFGLLFGLGFGFAT